MPEERSGHSLSSRPSSALVTEQRAGRTRGFMLGKQKKNRTGDFRTASHLLVRFRGGHSGGAKKFDLAVSELCDLHTST